MSPGPGANETLNMAEDNGVEKELERVLDTLMVRALDSLEAENYREARFALEPLLDRYCVQVCLPRHLRALRPCRGTTL